MKHSILPQILLIAICLVLLSLPRWIPASAAPASEDPLPTFDTRLSLRVLHGEKVLEMSLSEYLASVVSGELPPDFPPEAQKAQAIAARTYALRCARQGKHTKADVCTDSRCCQAWSSEINEAARIAVDETDGLVAVYEDELIEATYFSCSGGSTEDAEAVWGSSLPYLLSVSSPGEEDAPRFREELELEASLFAARLQSLHPDLILKGNAMDWFGTINYTQGGGIDQVLIGGVAFRGTELRQLFGLRSTHIRFVVEEDLIRITTLGYGHRVGMSQYGARAMALEGKDFAQIIGHYYQNTEIKRLFLAEEA